MENKNKFADGKLNNNPIIKLFIVLMLKIHLS